MLQEHFKFYNGKQDTSYGLFVRQNCKEHSDLITQFMTEKKGEFKLVINHFLNKLQLKPDAEQIIKQNLSSIYVWRNKQKDIEVYITDQSLLTEPKYQSPIDDNIVQQFYKILLNLSSVNIPDNKIQINTNNYLKQIAILYTELVDYNQKQQHAGNTDQVFKVLKIRTRNGLILRPSGDVITCPQITDKVSNFNAAHVYVSYRQPFWNPIQENSNPIHFKGSLDPETYWPNGYGEIECLPQYKFKGTFVDGLATGKCVINYLNWKQEFEGNFKYGERHGESRTKNPNGSITTGYYQSNMKQGLFQTKSGNSVKEQNYQNDILVNKSKYKFDSMQDSARYLVTHQDISLNNYAFNGLKDKQWLNQLCIDYYLQLVQDYYKCTIAQPIILFNTISCQDMFSSDISKVTPQNIQLSEEQKQILQNAQHYNRIIFILNADKVHFLVLVYQNLCLFMLNSFMSQSDQKILNVVATIFPKNIKTQVLQVEQQKNNYDCSLHSIHNVILQYKYYDKSVDNINYSVTGKYIHGLRRHLQHILTNDYEHLIPNSQ